MSSSLQSLLIQMMGANGGKYITGVNSVTGDFMAYKALSDSTFQGDTVGNIENISGALLSAGDYILGQFDVISVSGDGICYYS